MDMLDFPIFRRFSDKLIAGMTDRSMGSFNDQISNIQNAKLLNSQTTQNRKSNFENRTENKKPQLQKCQNAKLIELNEQCPIPDEQLNKIISVTQSNPIFSRQMHGDEIIYIDKEPEKQLQADAFITDKPGITLAVKIADCQGIILFDPTNRIIAAVHSGWRSTALDIVGKTIKRMADDFSVNPADIFAAVSPSLGLCCAQFTNPMSELPEFMHKYLADRNVDLWSVTKSQLLNSGVPENQIFYSGECTKCNPDKYFSHRNGDDGRMAVFVSMR